MKPSDLSSLIKAWDTLEERKRILRMKPKPKATEVKEPKKGMASLGLTPQE